MNYTTIRGFDVSGSTGRVVFAGNYSVVEYMHIHDVTDVGATLMFHAAVNPDCTPAFGNLHDITIRNNIIERGFGEGIYISGNYLEDGGCLAWGNTHNDILIEGNLIDQTLSNGGQPDNIDLKAGLMNLTIRKNILKGGGLQSAGIVSLGLIPGSDNLPAARTNYLIEDNLILNRQD